MFVWARPKDESVDTLALSQRAAAQNILLAPGHLFRPDQSPSPWLRFNVAYCDNDRLFTHIEEGLAACRRPVE
jgi:DNA-binding transcriptional MocR family regulator